MSHVLRRVSSAAALLAAPLATFGCNSTLTGLAGSDAAALAATDSATYHLTGAPGERLRIGFVYSNRTRARIWIVRCTGPFPQVEKLVDGEWVRASGGADLDCLRAFPIEAGGQLRERIDVGLGYFNIEPIQGTYRLVWDDVVWNFDAGSPPFGDLLPKQYRVSNRFDILE
jgi:hypothetical protein